MNEQTLALGVALVGFVVFAAVVAASLLPLLAKAFTLPV